MIFIGFLIGAIIFCVYKLIEVPYNAHKTMVKDYCKTWGIGTFEQFVNEFHKYKWDDVNHGWGSLFDRETNSQLHAEIFQFGGWLSWLTCNPSFLYNVLYIWFIYMRMPAVTF